MKSNDHVDTNSVMPQRVSEKTETTIDRTLLSRFRRTLDVTERIRRVEKIATLMDSAFQIPGTNRRIGLDSLIGLLPGVGDMSTFVVSCFIIREAWVLRMPKRYLVRMVWNVAVDTVLGSVPLFGDIFDFAFKSNLKNANLMLDYFQKSSSADQVT